MQGLSQEQFEALCREWQGILRLQDWDVIVRIVRQRDMEGKEHDAEVLWCLLRKEATVNILDPVDYPPDLAAPQDQEQALVHELIHLHFAPFMPGAEDELRYAAAELAIERLAQALVRLKRNGE